MMQHHIAHLLVELFTSEFHRRTYHPIANHTRNFLPGNTISSHFAGIVPHLGAHDLILRQIKNVMESYRELDNT